MLNYILNKLIPEKEESIALRKRLNGLSNELFNLNSRMKSKDYLNYIYHSTEQYKIQSRIDEILILLPKLRIEYKAIYK